MTKREPNNLEKEKKRKKNDRGGNSGENSLIFRISSSFHWISSDLGSYLECLRVVRFSEKLITGASSACMFQSVIMISDGLEEAIGKHGLFCEM